MWEKTVGVSPSTVSDRDRRRRNNVRNTQFTEQVDVNLSLERAYIDSGRF
jgi:hypothetical protein